MGGGLGGRSYEVWVMGERRGKWQFALIQENL